MNHDTLLRSGRGGSSPRVRAAATARAIVHRKCACGGSCDDCRKARETDVHRHAAGTTDVDQVPDVVHETLSAPGQALDAAARELFESRFRQDFSGVRVHADPRASESAAAVNALAYTVGRNIVFAAGQYSPDTSGGRELLAHELAHVVQDGGRGSGRPTAVSRRGDPTERSADALARSAMTTTARDAHAGGQSRAGVVQRQEETGPSKREQEKEALLRRLARRPSDAIPRWRSLSQKDRDVVVTLMGERYGDQFAQQFLDYATGVKKPNLSIDVTNTQPDPKALQAKGYRYFGNPGGIPVWVHPSGHEIHVLSGKKVAEPEPPESCEKRVEKCLVDTAEEDACRECCAEVKDDEQCRRQCEAACDNKL
jgi:hypothetical protein